MGLKTIWEPDGVYQEFSDIISNTDIKKANKEVHESPSFDTLKYWLINSLNIEKYEPEKKEAEGSAAQNIGASFSNKSLQMAFITVHPAQKNNIKKYISLLKKSSCPWEIEIFSDLESAREWVSQKK